MRIRLILSFMLVSLLSIVIVVVVAQQGTANEVRAFIYGGGSTPNSSGLIGDLEEYYRLNGNWSGVETVLQGHAPGRGQGKGGNQDVEGVKFILADVENNILVNTRDPEASGKLNLFERQSAISLQNDSQTVGYLVIVGGQGANREPGGQLISRLNNAALVAALIAGVLSLIIAWFLTYRLMKPVNELTQAAEQLGGGDLSGRVQVRGNDELAVLGGSFNQMADSLQQAEASRRAMTADIAHELRNPLAVQRANLEALQDGIYPLTVENLEPIIKQNDLLTRLVDDLRTLALADSGRLELDLVPTNVTVLVNRVVELYQPRAGERSVALGIKGNVMDGSDDFEVVADPMRLEQIISNLVDNALRYTPNDGVIDLQFQTSALGVKIIVHDGGPGIAEDALPYIFDRFYRADPSRSREDGGTGLGLAISRQLAQAHGGTLSAHNAPDGGAVFELFLPRDVAADNFQS
jgi:signal transduction histidine kinase